MYKTHFKPSFAGTRDWLTNRITRYLLCLGITASLVAGVPLQSWAVDRIDGHSRKELGLSKQAVPDVSVKAGELVTEDGRVLWSRNPDQQRAMASLTKIMTAVVAMEHSKPEDEVHIPSQSASVGESTSFLVAGETLPMSELLEALLVKSGNDAAIAIAIHVGGSEQNFVKMMNDKAAELGLKNTHYANPHGLDTKGHHTSASDLATLARYAMTKPEFASIVRRRTAKIHHAGNTQAIQSTNLLLGNYDGADGVKTGFTNHAGHSVVASAKREGIRLYAVVLGTKSESQRFADARELLDWGFAHYRPQHLASAGTAVGESVVSDYLDVTVPAAFSKDTTIPAFDLSGRIRRTVRNATVRAPVKPGQVIGVASFVQGDHILATVPLVATQEIKRPNLMERAWIGAVRLWRRITGSGPMTAEVSAMTSPIAVSFGGLA